jgi:hypothetical protein
MSEITAEQAAEVVQKEINERAEKCAADVAKILDKHKCRIDVVLTIRNDQMAHTLEIVALR